MIIHDPPTIAESHCYRPVALNLKQGNGRFTEMQPIEEGAMFGDAIKIYPGTNIDSATLVLKQ